MNDIDFLSVESATNTVRIVGLLIPLLTAAITKASASPRVKALTTLVLTVLTSVIATLVSDTDGYAWAAFFNAFINAFIPAIAAYYGLWKPTTVASSIGRGTGEHGVGKPRHRADVPAQ